MLDPASVLRKRRRQRVGVVEEDVDPDPRIRTGDAGHVAQRAAGGRERLVSLDARRPRLIQQHVRERVRKMAGERDEPVVRIRIDRDRDSPERRHEAVQQPVPLGIRRRHRSQEPGRAAKQPAVRVRRPVRLRAAHGMAADETAVAHRLRHRSLRRADVRHGGAVAAGLEDGSDLRRQRGDGCGDESQLGAGDGLFERRGGLDGSALPGHRKRIGIDVPPAHVRDAGGPRCESHRGSDQTGADDREPLHGHR